MYKKIIIGVLIIALSFAAYAFARGMGTGMDMGMGTGGGATEITLTKDADADQSVTFNVSLPDGYEVVIDWGDTNSSTVTGPQTSQDYTNAYADTNSYTITISGDYDKLTRWACPSEPLSGNGGQYAYMTNLTLLNFNGNSMTGDASGYSALTNLTLLGFNGNSMTGDASGYSALTNLTYLNFNGNSMTGDASGFAALTNLTYLIFSNNSITYTSTTLPDWDSANIDAYSNGWTETMVDAFLCDLDTSSTASTKALNIAGDHAAPSATGLACESSLEGKGWTVTVTGE
jgi:hypothetical protein